MLKTMIKATPDQVEQAWAVLTDHQRHMVDFARTVGKNLEVEVLSTPTKNLLWGLGVER